MKKKIKNKLYMTIVFVLLALCSLQFVTWISQMAFENTCIELQEQYIGTETGEVVNTIENSVNFGKTLDNYYGMDELLKQVCAISEGNLKAVVFDADGEALYLSFEQSEENEKLLAGLYAREYQEELKNVVEETASGKKISSNDVQSLVFPIYKNTDELVGHFIVLYEQEDLVSDSSFSGLELVKYVVWVVVSLALVLFLLLQKEREEKALIRYLPVVIIMIGMFCYIVSMYQDYKGKYSDLVSRNAQSAAVYLKDSVDDLLEKGLPVSEMDRVSNYLNEKVAGNVAIDSVSVVNTYYSTSGTDSEEGNAILSMDVGNKTAQLNVIVSESFVTEKVKLMTLTFGAVFVICLMITYELTNLAKLISVRLSREFNQPTPEQLGASGAQIKLLSFLAYTAIYISMSYTAVIMRGWDATLFGLSGAVSASLPLTVELLCILLCSVLVQRVFYDVKLERLLILAFVFLISGNAACTQVSSPYLLLGLRAFCGIGFGLMKYWFNAVVAAGSENVKAVGSNYAQLNAGLLGGITVGASLGSILAQALGYQTNYGFTAVICGIVLLGALALMPWKMLDKRRMAAAVQAQRETEKPALWRNPSALKAIVLGDIPLNIGLMYVVAFLPVYMDNIGKSSVATSYAYLVNGLAGVYIGVAMMTLLKKLDKKFAVVTALLLAAAGILVLTAHSGTGVILLSAGIMGLFDGYGTPTITSFFTGLKEVQKENTASMLTVFNSVGSAVQIICPALYNVLIQPDGGTLYLMIFGFCYVAVALLFLVSFRKKEYQ